MSNVKRVQNEMKGINPFTQEKMEFKDKTTRLKERFGLSHGKGKRKRKPKKKKKS